ncbi:hypothetical protein NCCP1664_12150 [Zafaria cholistanensis]|uniref:Uncharacterized protein n=1 Tax=Zafaria cholistanensis TaxID=1682741 RepID=A0A5A7NSD4_9MICC|nr:hypothetical protein NCCP1664_12150 [Zafaria cholistanensis]
MQRVDQARLAVLALLAGQQAGGGGLRGVGGLHRPGAGYRRRRRLRSNWAARRTGAFCAP